jgi:hypothetical protein
MDVEALGLEDRAARISREVSDLAFADAGFLGVYHFGVAAALRKYAGGDRPTRQTSRVVSTTGWTETRASGSSAGALAALCLLTDVPLGKKRQSEPSVDVTDASILQILW